jgi:hypothetical protein
MAKDLDTYIEKIKSICSSRDDSSLLIATDHMIIILDIITAFKKTLKNCAEKHPEATQQKRILLEADRLVSELDTVDSRTH